MKFFGGKWLLRLRLNGYSERKREINRGICFRRDLFLRVVFALGVFHAVCSACAVLGVLSVCVPRWPVTGERAGAAGLSLAPSPQLA